jgi:uncharacterized HAD superfamily protein
MWNVDPKEAERRSEQFHSSKHISNMATHANSDSIIKHLSKQYRLVIITGRRIELEQITLEWLDKHYPSLFSDVKFVNVWSHRGAVSTKAAIGKEIGTDYLIDDNLEQCKIAASVGIKTLLFGNYSWNKTKSKVRNITRVANWQEVKRYFDSQGQTSRGST